MVMDQSATDTVSAARNTRQRTDAMMIVADTSNNIGRMPDATEEILF